MKLRPIILAASALLPGACGTDAAPDAARPREPAKSVGQAVYEKWCAVCHADGPRMPGTLSLRTRDGQAAPAILRERKVPPAVTAYAVRNGIGAMPRFRKTEISDEELAQLEAYLAGADAGRVSRP